MKIPSRYVLGTLLSLSAADARSGEEAEMTEESENSAAAPDHQSAIMQNPITDFGRANAAIQGYAPIPQPGGNGAVVTQSNPDSDTAEPALDGNTAIIHQSGGGNRSTIVQRGKKNRAEQTQKGEYNDIYFWQDGEDNQSVESQTGAHNRKVKIQTGSTRRPSVTIDQVTEK